MSDEIKITIVTDDEKQNIKSEAIGGHSVNVTHDLSATLMSTLLKNNLISGSFCGGRGDCGRCKIQFLEGGTLPTPLERSVMEPEELRQGYRLACLTRPKDDCVIKLAFADAAKIDVVTDMIDVTEGNDYLSQQNEQTQNHKSDVTESMKILRESLSGEIYNTGDIRSCSSKAVIAVDLGTTTIAMQLMEMESGRIIDTYCELNPQRRYGSDVLSRVKASCDGDRAVLQQIVVETLERGVARFTECLGKNAPEPDSAQSGACSTMRTEKENVHICAMCIAGNTTMEHLLMGYDVTSLGRSPFTPVEIGLQEYKHPEWEFPVWLAPGISTFVGGDIVAGLYALGMLPMHDILDEKITEHTMAECERANRENADHENADCGKADLLIDLGTNGEMAITDGVRMLVTATAAGPAFEGGAGAGIIGSDMIACAASLLQDGLMDETGLLKDPHFTEGITVGEPPVRLCNKDIRDLQMAKAAVRAGVEILWRRMGEPSIRRVYLAGGFGYYLDVEAAFAIGLLPEHMRGRVEAVGNTSLAGAYMIARDLCRGRIDRTGLEQSIVCVESMNLAEQEEFEKLYVRYMNFLKS